MLPKEENGVVVLIVDDDPDARAVFVACLKHHGFDAVEAVNGAHGVEVAKTAVPDLILMDLMMPEMDGIEAATALRSDPVTSAIPIWAVSGHDPANVDKERIRALFTRYIKKPISLSVLLSAIHEQLEHLVLERGPRTLDA